MILDVMGYFEGCQQDGQGEAEEVTEQAAQHASQAAALQCFPRSRIRLEQPYSQLQEFLSNEKYFAILLLNNNCLQPD